jgi:hypothetical protein
MWQLGQIHLHILGHREQRCHSLSPRELEYKNIPIICLYVCISSLVFTISSILHTNRFHATCTGMFYLHNMLSHHHIPCTTLAFMGKQHWMLKIIQCFSKHCSCYLQGELVMVWHFWKLHQSAPSNPTHHLLPALYKA